MHFGELIFETSILVLMVNDTEHHGKNFMSWEILVKSIIAQIITMLMLMLVLINVALMLIMSVKKYGLRCGTSSKVWKNCWINPIDPIIL